MLLIKPNKYQLSFLTLLVFLIALSTFQPSLAADSSIEKTLQKLNAMYERQALDKKNALQEKTKIEAHISKIEAFRATLTLPKDAKADEKARQALAKDKDALQKVEERIRLADLQTNLTKRAIKYLYSEDIEKTDSLSDQLLRRALAWFTEEDRLNREVDRFFQHKYGFALNPDTEKRLKSLLDQLQATSLQPEIPLTVKILDTDSIGAMAAATSKTIYFYKGYLDLHPSNDELMFIAAHELSHVHLDHYIKNVVQLKGNELQNIIRLHQINSNDPNVKSFLYKQAVAAQMSDFNKEQETQADLLGAQQVLMTGASPKGIYEAISRMQKMHKDYIDSLNSPQRNLERLTTDHPSPEERLKNLEEVLGKKFWER